jgi:light-regulated signal transduction histidine kinase (bacteriophytochrome)
MQEHGMHDETAPRDGPAQQSAQDVALAHVRADLDAFANVVSHDLKAPLRALGQLVDWVTEDVQDTAGPETLENLALMKARVARLQTLLDGLLAHARAGHGHTRAEAVDMDELVADIAALSSPPPGFAILCDAKLGILRTHRAAIRTVLENLISNALKHHDGHEGIVSVGMTRTGATVHIRVADDGPGIAARHHQRIFVMFHTLAARNDIKSKGVGLAIVKKAVFAFTWQEEKEAVLF